MGALRQSRSFDIEMSGPKSQSSSSINQGYPSGVYVPSMNQGLTTLIVMIAVLAIILLFCFWGAPAVRAFCKRKVCCCCPMDEPSADSGSTVEGSATPTIILLPYGRMLVVDRTVFTQLQADHTGIDFMELSANLIRAQRIQTGSTPSFLDSDATSKGISPTSIDFLPPTYEEIFGKKTTDLPPSYSEISMILKNMSCKNSENGSGSESAGSERSARMLIKESVKLCAKDNDNVNDKRNATSSSTNGPDLGRYTACSFSTPNLYISSNVPFVSKRPQVNRQLKQQNWFSSLENNIGKGDVRNNNNSSEQTNNERVEDVCSSSGYNRNVIDKRISLGPNEPNWNSLLINKAKSKRKRRYNPEPSNSVQFTPSFSKNQTNLSDKSENEYVDRESSV